MFHSFSRGLSVLRNTARIFDIRKNTTVSYNSSHLSIRKSINELTVGLQSLTSFIHRLMRSRIAIWQPFIGAELGTPSSITSGCVIHMHEIRVHCQTCKDVQTVKSCIDKGVVSSCQKSTQLHTIQFQQDKIKLIRWVYYLFKFTPFVRQDNMEQPHLTFL